MKSDDPTSIGNATWTNISSTVTLASAQTINVTDCGTAWTAAASVSCTTSSTRREGTLSSQITDSSTTTGLKAHFTIASTDFSSETKISFWFRCSSSAVNFTHLRLSLCSDTAGVTQVDNFDLSSAYTGTVVAGRWYPITIDKGSALGASIQSVALYAQTALPSGVVILLDNIFTGDLNLGEVIGKNTGTETWWAIKSINGTTVTLDTNPRETLAHTVYYGATETVTTYRRDIINTNTVSFTISASGGAVLTISGGWNTTDMSTQTGVTLLDGGTSVNDGLFISAHTNIAVDKLGFFRYYYGANLSTATNITGNLEACNNNFDAGIIVQGVSTVTLGTVGGLAANLLGLYAFATSAYFTATNLYNVYSNTNNNIGTSLLNFKVTGIIQSGNNVAGAGIQCTGPIELGTVTSSDCDTIGLQMINASAGQAPSIIKDLTAENNGQYGLQVGGGISGLKVMSLTTSGNVSTGINDTSGYQNIVIYNANIGEGIVVSPDKDGRVYFQNIAGVYNDNICYTDGGNIDLDSADPYTGGGVDWKINLTAVARNPYHPIKWSIAKFTVESGVSTTITAYCKKSHLTNVTAQLVLPGGQVDGVPNDVVTDITTTTYAQYSINFTPTSDGVVELFYNAWLNGGAASGSAQVADMGVL